MTGAAPRRLRDLTWSDLADTAADSVLVVPFGATEQLGPRLPFTVGTDIADTLSRQLAAVRPDVVQAPAVPYGSGEGLPPAAGTLSIGQEALELLALELVRSADAFGGVFLVCGHEGDSVPLCRAVRRLREEGRRTGLWLPPGLPDDNRAGRLKTSAVMWLRGDVMRGDRGERRGSDSLSPRTPALRSGGGRSAGPGDVPMDPAGAGPEEGLSVLATWLTGLLAAYDEWAAGR